MVDAGLDVAAAALVAVIQSLFRQSPTLGEQRIGRNAAARVLAWGRSG